MTARRFVDAAGARIRYEVWGSGEQDMILIHGRHAHLRWWHATGELLRDRWRLIALDLSGHGDSDHRDVYSAESWVAEVEAVADGAGARSPVLVGHSMGARVALAAAIAGPDRYRSLITVDGRIRPGMQRFDIEQHPDRRPVVHERREHLVDRFRLLPPQPDPPAGVLDPVVDYAIKPCDGGWTWKFDPRVVPAVEVDRIEPFLGELAIPWGFVHAELSPLDVRPSVKYLTEHPPPAGVEVVMLPGTHHHLLLDSPQVTADVIDRLARELPGRAG